MPIEQWLEMSYRYGSPVVYSGVFIFILYKFGVRMLDSYERREASYATMINSGMAGITAQLQELSKAHLVHLQMYERISTNTRDGFDRMLEANKYQREEHREIIECIADGEKAAGDAREKILTHLAGNTCKA
jgi:hypothetical protein